MLDELLLQNRVSPFAWRLVYTTFRRVLPGLWFRLPAHSPHYDVLVQAIRCNQFRRYRCLVTALRIDRRQHLELAWQRQQGEDELLKVPATAAAATVTEVRNLAHLEQLVDSAGSAVVLLYCYSKVRTCTLLLVLS